MESTPPLANSPTTSQLPHRQPIFDFYTQEHYDSRYRQANSPQGLEIYADSMVNSSIGIVSTGANNRSPLTTSAPWSSATLHSQNKSTSSSSMSSIISAEYDPFAPFHQPPSSFQNEVYSTQATEAAAVPAFSVSSGNTSQRSSFSSAPISEILPQTGSLHFYTPRIKTEEPTDFLYGSDTLGMSPPHIPQGVMNPSHGYLDGIDTTYYHDQTPISWSKLESSSQMELPSISSLPIPQYGRRSESQDRIAADVQGQRRTSNIVARTRQPRKLTTKEEANYQCDFEGCGKLFGRSYNYKAHMETHDQSREYPFPCTQKDCEKKFVRKTDLQRHHQSVHMKQRNFRCDYCARLFARKDTLRRHMEDGCSKRFDIETLDFQAQHRVEHENRASRTAMQSPGNNSRPISYAAAETYSIPNNTATQFQAGHFVSDPSMYSNADLYSPGRSGLPPTWHG